MSEGSSKAAAPALAQKPRSRWGVLGGLGFTAASLLGPSMLLAPILWMVLSAAGLDNNNINSLGAISLEIVSILFIFGVVRAYGGRWKDVGLGAVKPQHLLFAIGGFVAYFVLASVLLEVLFALLPIDADQPQELGYESLSGFSLTLAFISLVIVTPFAEELMFRGFLFTGLRRRLPFWAVALIISAFFAWVHGQWNVGLDVFIMSLVLCTIREYSGSLWPSIFLHMLKNALAFLFLFVFVP